MNILSLGYSNNQLALAGVLTALQVFAVAAFFGQLTQIYAIIIVINATILPLLMAKIRPRQIDNLFLLLVSLVKLGLLGLFLAWLMSVALPRPLLESEPVILKVLSSLVAVSATLPPTILPFSFALVLLVLQSRAAK